MIVMSYESDNVIKPWIELLREEQNVEVEGENGRGVGRSFQKDPMCCIHYKILLTSISFILILLLVKKSGLFGKFDPPK